MQVDKVKTQIMYTIDNKKKAKLIIYRGDECLVFKLSVKPWISKKMAVEKWLIWFEKQYALKYKLLDSAKTKEFTTYRYYLYFPKNFFNKDGLGEHALEWNIKNAIEQTEIKDLFTYNKTTKNGRAKK